MIESRPSKRAWIVARSTIVSENERPIEAEGVLRPWPATDEKFIGSNLELHTDAFDRHRSAALLNR